MNKNDFKKGQTVYLKGVGRYQNTEPVEAKVKSVGSKYITTIHGVFNSESKFEIDNDFYEYCTVGGRNYELYLTMQQIEDDEEYKRLLDDIKQVFPEYGLGIKKIGLSLCQLRRIKAIIDEVE